MSSRYSQRTQRAPQVPLDTPPQYSEKPPQIQQQDFVFRYALGTLKVFASENSMLMYEDAKKYAKLDKKHPSFVHAKYHQNLSMGLPLLMSERAVTLGIGESTYLRLYEGVPSPNSNKLYNSKDNRQIGQVLIHTYVGYQRYRIQIKGVEVVLIVHSRLPIADVRIGNDRLRFVRALNGWDAVISRTPFSYGTYILDAKQTSLIDGMDSSLTVNKRNPLLGNMALNLLAGNWRLGDRKKYISPYQCGSFDASWSGGLIMKNKRCATLSMAANVGGHPDSNNSVDMRSLMLVAVSLVLHHHELDIQETRASGHSSRSNHNSILNNSIFSLPLNMHS